MLQLLRRVRVEKMDVVLDPDVLHYTCTPREYKQGPRCYYSLVKGLPSDKKILPTYCNCARGFVEEN